MIARLQGELVYLRKKVFGSMSEKHLPLDPCQLTLFDQHEMSDEEKAALAEEVAKELLGSYRGNAQTDGYNAYVQFEGQDSITMYGCWAHACRKFVESLDTDRKHATEAIEYAYTLLPRLSRYVNDGRI